MNESIKILRDLADNLKCGIFPIKNLPVEGIRLLMMEIFQGNLQLVHVKMSMLEHIMACEDYEGGALFFYEMAQMANMSLIYSWREKAGSAFSDKVLDRFSDNKCFKGKGVVYTVLTGNYDSLKEPEYVDLEFDYICFTDDDSLESANWTIRKLKDEESLGVQRLSRKPKILVDKYLGEYDYSIYIDSKLRIKGNLYEYINRYSMGAPMLCFPHYERDCVYEEADVCIQLKKDKEDAIRKQTKRYRHEGMPEHYGLIEAACMVRAHRSQEVIKVMNDWWDEFLKGCCRDQISFPYVCWKNNFHYDISNLFIDYNEYLKLER